MIRHRDMPSLIHTHPYSMHTDYAPRNFYYHNKLQVESIMLFFLEGFVVLDKDWCSVVFIHGGCDEISRWQNNISVPFQAFCVSTEDKVEEGMRRLVSRPGPVLMEVKIRSGFRSDLGRPTRTTHENKADFMEFLRSWWGAELDYCYCQAWGFLLVTCCKCTQQFGKVYFILLRLV